MREFICPVCFGGALARQPSQLDSRSPAIDGGGYVCECCRQVFPIVCDVPYLGRFYEKDFLSVIEISSFLRDFVLGEGDKPKRIDGQDPLLRAGYQSIQRMVSEARDVDGAGVDFATYGYSSKPGWFASRFNEFSQLQEVLATSELSGKTVLDIGAGTGFDAYRFRQAGGRVNALEFSPLQAAIGAMNFPEINWIGGSVTHIPFPDESFDFVIANAALHHVLDLEAAMDEMLRVLKVGGELVTMADSFGPDTFTEADEVSVFNDHLAVLGGVNEQIPRLGRFLSPLAAHADRLSATVMTSVVHGLHARSDRMRPWTLEEASTKLARYRGGLCIRAKKERSTAHRPKCAQKELIDVQDYVLGLRSREAALSRLALTVPAWAVDLPILDRQHEKLRLLLGWRRQGSEEKHREAVSKAFLFVTEDFVRRELPKLVFSVPRTRTRKDEASVAIHVRLNGQEIANPMIPVGRWSESSIEAPPSWVPAGRQNLLSFGYQNEGVGLEDRILHVATRESIRSTSNSQNSFMRRAWSRLKKGA